MGRVIIGAVAAAVAMFIIGFVLYATPLSKLAYASLDNPGAAAVQQSLAANLPRTGTYAIPNADASAAQTVMYGQGPIATVHYNTNGFSSDAGALVGGLVLNFVTALLIGAALLGLDRYVHDFPARGRIVVLFAVAASAYIHLGEPIFLHHDWLHFIYLFIADAAVLAAGGLIIARWFLPSDARSATADAPSDV
jgi:hypothetical protein